MWRRLCAGKQSRVVASANLPAPLQLARQSLALLSGAHCLPSLLHSSPGVSYIRNAGTRSKRPLSVKMSDDGSKVSKDLDTMAQSSAGAKRRKGPDGESMAVKDETATPQKPTMPVGAALSDSNTAPTPVTADSNAKDTAKPAVKVHPFFAKKAQPTAAAKSADSSSSKPAAQSKADNSGASAKTTVLSPSAPAVGSSKASTALPPAPGSNGSKPTLAAVGRVLEEDEGDGTGSGAGSDEEDIELGKAKSRAAGAGASKQAAVAQGYDPVRDACWPGAKPGAPVPYSALATVFGEVEGTTKRLEITAALTRFFRSIIALSPADLLPALYLCTNTLAPAYESVELGVGESLLQKALAEATGRQVKQIQADAERQEGDLGLVAESSRAMQKTLFGHASAALTLRGVLAAYRGIATESGKASQDKKIGSIKKLLVASSGPEAKYLIRGMLGKLRIGLAKATVMVALAHAITLTPPLPLGTQAPAGREGLVYGPAERGKDVASDAPYPPVLLSYPPVLLSRLATEDRLETDVSTLKQLYSELPSFDTLVPALLTGGIKGARAVCQLTPGIPVAPMLAKPTRGIGEVLTRFEGASPTEGPAKGQPGFTCEWKYDGERAQVHLYTAAGGSSSSSSSTSSEGLTLRVFSRNSEDTTSKYPDVAQAIREVVRLANEGKEGQGQGAAAPAAAAAAAAAGDDEDMALGAAAPRGGSVDPPLWPVTSCVLDGEAVAYDPAKGNLLPFQILSTRARKDATMESIKVPVIYVAFDLLYLNGVSLIHRPLAVRRRLLREALVEVPGRFSFARGAESSDTEEIGVFLQDAVKGGCEGLMVKLLHGPEAVYRPSNRSLSWLKLKKDYMDGMSDSVDLVPIAAWRGKGKRSGVYGAYLLACYDAESDEYQSVCKVGTGFSEEALEELAQALGKAVTGSKPRNCIVGEGLSDADVWFSPEDSECWEVRAADLSLSPVHKGGVGKVDEVRGIGLRFPRFIRRRAREDKGPQEATSADQIVTMYKEQATVANGAAGDGDDDDE